VTTFELPGCEDMWTIISTLNNEIKVRSEISCILLILRQDFNTFNI